MKRIISCLLVLVMVFGMIPAVLAAETSETSDTYTIVKEVPAALAASDTSQKGVWYINGSVFDYTEGAANYTEIAEEGCLDTGSLHVYQDNVANHDMSVGMFLGGQPAGTYTVKLYVKGDVGHNGQTCKFFPYGTDGQVSNLSTILGGTMIGDWTEVSYEVEVSKDFYYLIFSFSKYNWVSDMYVDNIQLINSSGVNVLGSGGNFFTLEEVTVNAEDVQIWPDTSELDTEHVAGAYSGTLTDAWSAMYPTGIAGDSSWATWPAWDDTHYAEVVSNGYTDAGSLHLVSCATKNTGIAINAGMTADETYTLGFYAKGTVNTGRVLALYGNGDGVIISNTASLKAGWNYYEHTFTAGMSQLNLVASDWGSVDIYLDNITLTDADGKDLLAGNGDFCTEKGTAAGPDILEIAPTNPGENYIWYNHNSFVNNETKVMEIVEDGADDIGSVHVYQPDGQTADGDMLMGIRVDCLPTGTYTLSYKIKGSDLGNTDNNSNKFYLYGNDTLTNQFRVVAGVKSLGDWTEFSETFTTTCDVYYIYLMVSKYVNGADYYVDNVRLMDADGNDLLKGCGDFCTKDESEEPETQPEYKDPTEEGWIGRDDYTQLELGVDYDYSFAVLGDIQHITDYTPTDLPYLFDYILDNKDSKNIQFVFGMGDTTNDNHNEANNLREWKLAQEQFFRFNGVIPYTVVRGNHDVVVRMNAYFADPNKPGYTDQLDGFYQEGSVVNVWKEFSVAGVDYLSLLIDYESSDSVLAWAADVIESHPNHRVIVNTHVYMNPDGSYDNEMNPKFANVGILNNAQQVWDKLISQHKNIFMVLCGHTSTDDVLIQQKTGVHGNQITEIRVDSQYTDLVYMNKDGDVRGGSENGVGMVTLMYFKNDGTQVAVEHYSVLRQWYRQLQTFEIEEYEYYSWRYDETEQDSYQVDLYQPVTGVEAAPAILQNGLGSYCVDDFVTENGLAYEGTGISILPDHNMNLGTHTYALHSGTRAVEPSATYTISYQIKGLGENGRTWTQIHFCRSALGGSDTWESQWSEGQVIQGPVDDWQTVSYDVTMDDKTSAIEIYYIVNGSELLIDDVSVVKKGSSDNIITNGDFELGNDGEYPTGFYTMKTGGIGKVEKISGVGVDGSAAVRIEPRPGYILKTAETIAVEGNTEYTLSYMVRIPGKTTDLTPVLRLYDANGTMTVLTGTAANVSGSCDWKRVTYTFTTAADTAGVQVCLLAYGGKVTVDNLSLTAGSNELMENGNFSAQLKGFDGEFVQGLQEGTVVPVSSARPDSLIVEAKAENGVLSGYQGDSCIGTVDWLYGELEHKVNFGLRIGDADTAEAVAAWITQRHVENLWVVSGDAALLNTVLTANHKVRAVLDCTAAAVVDSTVPYVLVGENADIAELQNAGLFVIVASNAVTTQLLESGADGILTTDAFGAIQGLELIPVKESEAVVEKWNLSLGENIGANFYIKLDPEKAANAAVKLTVEEDSETVALSQLTPVDGYYVVSANVAAAQMTDTITVEILMDGAVIQQKEYTVRQYADEILAGSYDDTAKALVREMLRYGSAAQTYFGYHTESLADNGIIGAGEIPVPDQAKTELSVTDNSDAISFYSASLLFRSETAVRLYFTGDLTGYTFTANGSTYTPVEKDGMYYVEIDGINPDALADAVTLSATDGNGTVTVVYSPMNYLVRMSKKGSDTLKLLLQAMYNYHLAAVSYKNA